MKQLLFIASLSVLLGGCNGTLTPTPAVSLSYEEAGVSVSCTRSEIPSLAEEFVSLDGEGVAGVIIRLFLRALAGAEFRQSLTDTQTLAATIDDQTLTRIHLRASLEAMPDQQLRGPVLAYLENTGDTAQRLLSRQIIRDSAKEWDNAQIRGILEQFLNGQSLDGISAPEPSPEHILAAMTGEQVLAVMASEEAARSITRELLDPLANQLASERTNRLVETCLQIVQAPEA